MFFSLPNKASVSLIGGKATPVSKVFNFACLQIMCTVAAVVIMDRMVAKIEKHPLCSYLIPTSFAVIDRQNPLESLVLPVIWNLNQMFVMKVIEFAHALSNFVKYGFLNYWLGCQNNA